MGATRSRRPGGRGPAPLGVDRPAWGPSTLGPGARPSFIRDYGKGHFVQFVFKYGPRLGARPEVAATCSSGAPTVRCRELGG
eukprot:8031439-Heterocapsa_arctica.AAC.1